MFANMNEMFMSAMYIDKPENLEVYRYAENFDKNSDAPLFFGAKETALLYVNPEAKSPTIYKVLFKQELRLLNASSWIFSFHFMDMLNKFIGNSPEELKSKKKLCFPIGIPNLNIQTDTLNEIDTNHTLQMFNKMIRPETQYFPEAKYHNIFREELLNSGLFPGNRKSYKSIDYQFADMLKQIYGKLFHGFIIDKSPPTIWGNIDENGKDFYFHSEICIFDISKINCTVEELKVLRKNTEMFAGGASCNICPGIKSRELPDEKKYKEEYKESWVKSLINRGFTREEVLQKYYNDRNGTIILPSLEMYEIKRRELEHKSRKIVNVTGGKKKKK